MGILCKYFYLYKLKKEERDRGGVRVGGAGLGRGAAREKKIPEMKMFILIRVHGHIRYQNSSK
jgi:hypothetical protein